MSFLKNYVVQENLLVFRMMAKSPSRTWTEHKPSEICLRLLISWGFTSPLIPKQPCGEPCLNFFFPGMRVSLEGPSCLYFSSNLCPGGPGPDLPAQLCRRILGAFCRPWTHTQDSSGDEFCPVQWVMVAAGLSQKSPFAKIAASLFVCLGVGFFVNLHLKLEV